MSLTETDSAAFKSDYELQKMIEESDDDIGEASHPQRWSLTGSEI